MSPSTAKSEVTVVGLLAGTQLGHAPGGPSSLANEARAMADACAGDWDAVRGHLVVAMLRQLATEVDRLQAPVAAEVEPEPAYASLHDFSVAVAQAHLDHGKQAGVEPAATGDAQLPGATRTWFTPVTDEMVHAALKVQFPAMYRDCLRHPANGPTLVKQVEHEIGIARAMVTAAMAVSDSIAGPQAPSTFVAGAQIKVTDDPHTVIRKLDFAFHDAKTQDLVQFMADGGQEEGLSK